LARILWLKSSSSENWIDKRTNFTRSLAVMSMVGYILGLGDRHPSNLMLDRNTGMVIHIDFGDCFEVGMVREKHAEKIPFRLTRMLVNAMEVSGVEGTFRITCEQVMNLLRKEKLSLLAVLDSFVHDPLINWRLLDEKDSNKGLNKSPGVTLDETVLSEPNLILNTMTQNNSNNNSNNLRENDVANRKAIQVITRITSKLHGKDFNNTDPLSVSEQVQRLIQQAQSEENLCQCYYGWCPFW
jgi:FKBP12-rapamycin complex-associated protein